MVSFRLRSDLLLHAAPLHEAIRHRRRGTCVMLLAALVHAHTAQTPELAVVPSWLATAAEIAR